MSMNASLVATSSRHHVANGMPFGSLSFDRRTAGRPQSAFHGFFDAWLTLDAPPEGVRFQKERAHHRQANRVAALARSLVEHGVAARPMVDAMASALRGKAARFLGDDVYAGSWAGSVDASLCLGPVALAGLRR